MPSTTDMSKFKNRGGKLLLYHGWADPAIQPEHTVDLLQQRAREDGQESEQLDATVHGSRNGSLQRRSRAESDRLDRRSGKLAREGTDSDIHHRQRHERRNADDTAIMPASAGRDL